MKNTAARLLLAAAALLLLAGAIFAFMKQWLHAALPGAGALGCAAAALSHRGGR